MHSGGLQTRAPHAGATTAAPADMESALPCPLCGYDLRGLTSGRCPECGHAFDPAELRAAQRREADRPLPWLIEYPPTGRLGLIRNALLTPLLTLRPFWFWRRMRPSMRIEREKLLLYPWLSWLALALVVFAVVLIEPFAFWAETFLHRFLTLDSRYANHRMQSGWGWYWSLRPRCAAALVPVILLGAWPWLTLGILASFRASLRQARIVPSHLLRCVTYSADLAVPVGILLFLTSGVLPHWPSRFDATDTWELLEMLGLPSWFAFGVWYPAPLFVTGVAMLLWFGVRLCIAYRHYLAFPHAIATVISSQVILWLVLALIWLFIMIGNMN